MSTCYLDIFVCHSVRNDATITIQYDQRTDREFIITGINTFPGRRESLCASNFSPVSSLAPGALGAL